MKKALIALCLIIIAITICGCGKVHDADIMLSPSERYSEKELETAANITKTYFLMNYDGCELKYISYNDIENEKGREGNLNNHFDPERKGDLKDIIQLDVCYTDNDNAEKIEDYILGRYKNSGWEIIGHGF